MEDIGLTSQRRLTLQASALENIWDYIYRLLFVVGWVVFCFVAGAAFTYLSGRYDEWKTKQRQKKDGDDRS